jgi:hypothetical protein
LDRPVEGSRAGGDRNPLDRVARRSVSGGGLFISLKKQCDSKATRGEKHDRDQDNGDNSITFGHRFVYEVAVCHVDVTQGALRQFVGPVRALSTQSALSTFPQAVKAQ